MGQPSLVSKLKIKTFLLRWIFKQMLPREPYGSWGRTCCHMKKMQTISHRWWWKWLKWYLREISFFKKALVYECGILCLCIHNSKLQEIAWYCHTILCPHCHQEKGCQTLPSKGQVERWWHSWPQSGWSAGSLLVFISRDEHLTQFSGSGSQVFGRHPRFCTPSSHGSPLRERGRVGRPMALLLGGCPWEEAGCRIWGAQKDSRKTNSFEMCCGEELYTCHRPIPRWVINQDKPELPLKQKWVIWGYMAI